MNGRRHEPTTHQLIRQIFRSHPGSLIHAGTFFGDMLPSFSESVGDQGVVYAFEPVLESYVLAKKCIEFNRLPNVILFNSGLSDRVKSLTIHTENGKRGGASVIRTDGSGDQLISTCTIDMLDSKDIQCIQLDVEGHERDALSGATETIARCSPIILVEDNKNNCSDLLHGFGYRFIGEIPGLKVWTEDGEDRFNAALGSLGPRFTHSAQL